MATTVKYEAKENVTCIYVDNVQACGFIGEITPEALPFVLKAVEQAFYAGKTSRSYEINQLLNGAK